MAHSETIEPGRVYVELVEALFTAVLPFAIMAATFACVGCFVVVVSGDGVAAAALLVGLVATAEKTRLHIAFRRSPDAGGMSPAAASVWERRFAVGNLGFAAALGSLAARSFMLPQAEAQLLATGMLFGFCAGQVARIAVRARLCGLSICVASVPCALAAAAHGGVAHIALAGMFAIFALGSLESVRFGYSQTRARIATNHELASVASVDPLTGLLNRLGLRRAVEDRFGATAPSPSLVGVHCLDLDGFKAVNDRLGHAAGDAVLVEIARRILECTRDGDVAARFGGDEFVLLQTGIAHRDEVELFARRVCRAVTASLVLDGTSLSVGVSIGSCTGEIAREPFDDLLAVADRRMYAAKQDGGGVHAAALAG